MVAHVHYGNQEAKVLTSVVVGVGPNLLGHDWLQRLKEKLAAD